MLDVSVILNALRDSLVSLDDVIPSAAKLPEGKVAPGHRCISPIVNGTIDVQLGTRGL